MDRKTCGMAPVFDCDKFLIGTRVHYVKRNRKGNIKKLGTGKVVGFGVTCLVVAPDDGSEHLDITAKSVYYGKDNLKILSSRG